MKTVWRDLDAEDLVYVPRCSRCGTFKDQLKVHWFFTGIYCVTCIRLTLYDDTYCPFTPRDKYWNEVGEKYKGEVV